MTKSAKESKTAKLQQELKMLLEAVGWSKKELAIQMAASEENRSQDKNDPNKEYENVRKALTRSSTKPETLHCYINFVIEHNKHRELYRLPEVNGEFSESELEILKSVREIAHNAFQNEQNYC